MAQRKILFAIGRLSVGGAEKLLVHQLRVIDKDKFDPHLLTLFSEQKENFEKEVSLDSRHWKKFNFHSLFDFVSWLQLFNFLRKEKFDAVVTSLFSANLIVRTAAILLRVPVIVSYEHNLYPDKHRWQIWMDWLLSKWTNVILVDAESVREFTSKQEGIPKSKFLTLYIPPLLDANFPKDPALVRQELGIPLAAPVVLTVSRLVLEKGHSYLIEAAAQVIKAVPDAYFVLVGWGPLENSLKLKVKSEKLEGRVLLPGRMDIQDVLPITDIYVEPAVSVDIGIALMEAMRFGKAIVATRVGEMPVFVKDGETGFLAEPKDVVGLAEKIILLLQNEVLRKKLGQSAFNKAKSFTLEKYMETFEKIILGKFQNHA